MEKLKYQYLYMFGVYSIALAILLFILTGCSQTEIDIIKGDAGSNGTNGHSLVTEYSPASELECATEGSRLDIYLDADDDFELSDADVYQSSIVACNGANGSQGLQGVAGTQGPQGEVGPQGPAGSNGLPGPVGAQGPQGPQGIPGAQGPAGPSGSGATIQASTSSCVNVVGNYYLKNNTLYLEDDSNLCDGNHDRVSMNSSGDSLWVSANKLVVKDGNGIMRVITFN